MGQYFVLSTHFNKSSASDFGFISNGPDTAINPSDHSLWGKCNLYDFGWGKENGYYKLPLPDYNTLLQIVQYSTSQDDIYGAAAVLLDKYPDKLLAQCEKIMNDHTQKKVFKRFVELFQLAHPVNRCSTTNKQYAQIKADFARWKRISEEAKKCAR